jgi:hypothetical protein
MRLLVLPVLLAARGAWSPLSEAEWDQMIRSAVRQVLQSDP